MSSKLAQLPWLGDFFLFFAVPLALVWPTCTITLRVFEGITEEKEEWSRRREQYTEEARRAWANGVDLGHARGSFWQSLLRDGHSRP